MSRFTKKNLFIAKKVLWPLAVLSQESIMDAYRERSGSVVECLIRDQEAAGLSLTGITALWSLSKTHLL